MVFELHRAATWHMLDWLRRCTGDLRRHNELEFQLHRGATLLLGIKCHLRFHGTVFEGGDSQMTQRKQAKAIQRRGRHKAGTRYRPAPRHSGQVRRRPTPFDSDWDDFKAEVKAAITRIVNSPPGTKFAPFDRADSVLKRMVYGFVREHRPTKRYHHLETAIANDRDEWRGLRVHFEDNPFHWVLVGLKDHVVIFGKFEIKKSDITRFGRQLSYADRHNIAPQLLIGFLVQTGTISEICQKVTNPETRERWYLDIQNNGEPLTI